MGKQGKGRRLTDKERLEIIALTRQNPRIKHVELAAKYSVNESTIRKWRAQSNASKIEERYAHGVAASRDGRQRGQAVRNAQFDTELYEWVVDMTKQGVDLAPARVREKARALATQYEGMEGFKASSGWFYRFCRRYGLPCGPAGRSEASSKLHDDITIASMMPDDASAPGVAEATLAQHASAVAAAQASLAAAQEAHAALQHVDAHEMDTTTNDAAAIALSLQPPPASIVSEPRATPSEEPPAVTADAIPAAEAPIEGSEIEGKAQVIEAAVAPPPAAASELLLGLGEMASAPPGTASAADVTTIPSSATVSPSETTIATVASSVAATAVPLVQPQVFSMAQAAATHMVQHFKDVLDPHTRLRLVRHLTRVAGEAEMYLVMDDETRLEYVKEFAAASTTATPSPSASAESTS